MTDKQIIDEQLNAETTSGLCKCGSGLEPSIMVNPYIQDVCNEIVEQAMCEVCYQRACEDI